MIKKQSATGFTLIEIVIAISLLTVVMTVAYSSLRGILRTKELLDDRREARLIANSILTRLCRELQLAYAGDRLLPPRDDLKNFYSSRIKLLGEDVELDDGYAGDALTFISLEGGQYLPDGGRHSGVVQISYKLVEDPETYQASKPKVYSLIREETPYQRPYKKAYENMMIFPISKNVVSFNLSFFDEEEELWYSYWGTKDRVELPAIVKFSISIKSPKGKIDTYTTAVKLRNRD